MKTATGKTNNAVSANALVPGMSESVEKPSQPAPPIQECTTRNAKLRWSDHQTVAGVGFALTRMASAAVHQKKTQFDSDCQLAMSLCEYLKRLRRSFECSDECYVMGLIYIDRLLELHPDIGISFNNCHNLLITSIVLAAKFHDEAYHKNQFYAEAGYITAVELNAMEWRFLELLDWKLQIYPGEYNIYCETLRREGKEGSVEASIKPTCTHPQRSTSTFVRPCSTGQQNSLAHTMRDVAQAIIRAMHKTN